MMYLVRGGSRGTGDATAPGSGDGHPVGGPSAGLLLTEPIRGLADLAGLLLAAPGLAAGPRGDGHGVLVFPGLLAGDSSTVPLRAYLRWLGYDVRGWDLGRNHGPTEAVLAGLPRAVLDHAERTGRPVSLVGWSLGGVYAREMARRHPRQVRQVITLGSPYALIDPRQSHAHAPYQRLSFLHAPPSSCPAASSGPGPSTCRRRRSTPAGTAWWPGRRASSRRRRCTRTSRSAAATSASAWIRRRSG